MKTLNEVQQAQIAKRPLLEKDVQKACVEWARARGWWARKFSSQSQRSVPDYIFSRATFPGWEPGLTVDAHLQAFACEFKAPGKTSTDAQIDEQNAMAAAGWTVLDCDNLEDFKQYVESL